MSACHLDTLLLGVFLRRLLLVHLLGSEGASRHAHRDVEVTQFHLVLATRPQLRTHPALLPPLLQTVLSLLQTNHPALLSLSLSLAFSATDTDTGTDLARLWIHKEVGWLDVLMDDAVLVHDQQRFRHLDRHLQELQLAKTLPESSDQRQASRHRQRDTHKDTHTLSVSQSVVWSHSPLLRPLCSKLAEIDASVLEHDCLAPTIIQYTIGLDNPSAPPRH